MPIDVDGQRIFETARADRELAYKLRGFTGRVRLGILGHSFDLLFENGTATALEAPTGGADFTLEGTEEFWNGSLGSQPPTFGYISVTTAGMNGLSLNGDFVSVVAPWFGGWQRLYIVVRAAILGSVERAPFRDPYRETDNAIGRYIYITANDQEARVYYETAGTGPIPLLLQATAGADGRQYRHLLADPRMQERFTMYAYDLPYHGKSLPPVGVRWWEQPYTTTRDELMNWAVALADALGLENPYFMGCSVGGQMALDLAAEHPDRFGAFISLNGWYDLPSLPEGFSNDMFRTPAISSDYAPQLNFGATAPTAPEPNAHELYWIYRSSFPGIYAGDNDYFAYGHDLKENGHKIDAHAKPVYVITGDYEASLHDDVHGAAAVERNIAGAKHINLPRLGHFAPSDDPIAFNDAIVPILDEVIERAKAGAGAPAGASA